MRRLVRDAQHDAHVIATARQAVAGADGFSRRSLADAVARWLAERVRYVPDPLVLEVVRPPAALLRELRERGVIQEDCESLATLTAALMESVGVPTRFVVAAPRADGPYEHVWVQALTEDGWLDYDLAVRAPRIGLPPRQAPRMAVWEDRMPLLGLGQFEDTEQVFTARSPEELVGRAPAPSSWSSGTAWSGTTRDTAGSDRIDWSGVIGAIGSGIASVGAAAVKILPILERYGVLQPVPGHPSRLPYPGEPEWSYATSTGYPFAYLQRQAAAIPTWVWLAGAGVLILAMAGRRRRAAA